MNYRHSTHRLVAGPVALVITLALALVPAPVAGTGQGSARGRDDFVKVGYFIQWGIYGRSFVVRNLEDSGSAGRLTHINYAFGNVKRRTRWRRGLLFRRPVGGLPAAVPPASPSMASPMTPGAPLRGNFNQLKKLKAKHPDLKVLISLGGWTLSKYFSDARPHRRRRGAPWSSRASTCSSRATCPGARRRRGRRGVRRHRPRLGVAGFGGQRRQRHPRRRTSGTSRRSSPSSAPSSTRRRRTDEHYELTAFLPGRAGQDRRRLRGRQGLRPARLRDRPGVRLPRHLGDDDEPPGAAVLADVAIPTRRGFSLDLAIDSYRARGAPAGKLVVGVPYFGRGWTGVPRANNGLYQTVHRSGAGHVRGRGRGLQGAGDEAGPASPRSPQRRPLALRRHRSGGATTTRSPSPARCSTCGSTDSAGRWCGRSTLTTRAAR